MARLFLVDCYNVIYRACLVKGPELTAPNGEPTKGPYIFTRSLFRLTNLKPDYLVFCLDGPRKELFRRKIDETYKAKRSEPNPQTVSQVRRCVEIITKLGLPIVKEIGFEADDLIASLCDRFSTDLDCVILSSDKDLHQLVNDKVSLFDLLSEQRVGTNEVTEKWGVGPDKVIEMQILMGDSSDNIKGVEGIGHKRALDLILEYGSAQEAKNHADKLPPSVSKGLAKADLDKLRAMVSLRKDVPISIDKEQLKFTSIKIGEEAKSLFSTLGFKRWSQ